MSASDHYELLGVSRDASLADIKSAFRKHAKQWHPDLNKHPDAAARFRTYNEAYECLSRPETRAAYDATLRHTEQRSQNYGFKERNSRKEHAREKPNPEPEPDDCGPDDEEETEDEPDASRERPINAWFDSLVPDPACLVTIFDWLDTRLRAVAARRARRHS